MAGLWVVVPMAYFVNQVRVRLSAGISVVYLVLEHPFAILVWASLVLWIWVVYLAPEHPLLMELP